MLELVQGTRVRRVPFWLRVDRPMLATKKVRPLTTSRTYHGNTLGAGNSAIFYRYPTDASPLGLPTQVRRPGPAVALPPAARAR